MRAMPRCHAALSPFRDFSIRWVGALPASRQGRVSCSPAPGACPLCRLMASAAHRALRACIRMLLHRALAPGTVLDISDALAPKYARSPCPIASAKRLWDSLRGVRGGSFSPCPIDGTLVVEACICRANRLTSRSSMFWAYAGSVRPQAAVAKAPALSPLRTQRSAVGGLQMGKGIEFPAVSALLLVPKLKANARMCAYRHAFSRASMCLRHACWHA